MKTKLIALSLLLGLASCNKETLNYSYIDNIGDSEISLALDTGFTVLQKGDTFVFEEETQPNIFVMCYEDCVFRYNGAIYYKSTRLK